MNTTVAVLTLLAGVALCCVARQTCRIGSNRQREKIIIPFSKNAGHLLISRDRGTSDENAGLSLRMRDG